ncbi:hypothetical protein PAPYR_9030 [Paratrimastix pyriformis]|uniref:Uncharacterized protein n=1 Tax=Paratrimastix pyriformis TaxID=342808 RepID=A0ABQ8UAW9_9EUKA|nr:hypothetical protein PAPYR_9030 [Paratrimastix pyriformis]
MSPLVLDWVFLTCLEHLADFFFFRVPIILLVGTQPYQLLSPPQSKEAKKLIWNIAGVIRNNTTSATPSLPSQAAIVFFTGVSGVVGITGHPEKIMGLPSHIDFGAPGSSKKQQQKTIAVEVDMDAYKADKAALYTARKIQN